MDLGLYQLKYPVRKLISVVLPAFRNVDPNVLSWSLLPVGVVTAWVYWAGAQGQPWLYLVGIGLIGLRMFLGTLDGLVAVEYGKSTPRGEIVNRLTPELCDVMLLVALVLARPEWVVLGMVALGVAWLTTFAGLIGAAIAKPIQSVGPVGQTDRIAALMLFSLLAFFGETRGWRLDMLTLFLWWTVIGGVITIGIRLYRNLINSA